MIKNFRFHHKFIIIMIAILVYSLFLMLYDDKDFTGIVEINEKIDSLKNKSVYEEKKIKGLLNKFLDRLSFVLVTTSTIGYGDIIPKKTILRIINSLYIISIIFITFHV